jgi:hypothetical protein
VAGDTDAVTARVDTDCPSGRRRLAQSREAAQTRRRLYLILAVVGAVTVVLVAVVLWLALRRGSAPPRSSDAEERPRHATTRRVGPGERYKSIAVALDAAQPGDRIVVQAEVLAEPPLICDARTLAKDVTLEAADPRKKVLWKLPAGLTGAASLATLTEVEGFRFKGFVFDGENKVANLVHLCACKGIRLEDVELRNFTKSGVRFTNCAAPADKPIVLSRVTVGDTRQPPLVFEVLRSYSPLKNDHIVVRDDCTFPAGAQAQFIDLKGGENEAIALPRGLPVFRIISDKE